MYKHLTQITAVILALLIVMSTLVGASGPSMAISSKTDPTVNNADLSHSEQRKLTRIWDHGGPLRSVKHSNELAQFDTQLQPLLGTPQRATGRDVAIKNINKYRHISNKRLDPGYWESLSREDVENAAEVLRPDYTDKAVDALADIAEKLGTKVHGAFLTDAILIGTNLVLSFKHDTMAEILRDSDQTRLRTKLNELAENGEKLKNRKDVNGDNKFTFEDKIKLYTERKKLLEQAQRELVDFDDSLYANRDKNTADTKTQNLAYGNLRGEEERIRSLLSTDYHATTSWLKNRPSTSNLAKNAGAGLKKRDADKTYQLASRTDVDTLSSADDFALYEFDITEKHAGDERTLYLKINDPYGKDEITTYVMKGDVASIENPSSEYEPSRDTGSVEEYRISDSSGLDTDEKFYLLVKSNGETTYSIQSTSRNPAGLDGGNVLPKARPIDSDLIETRSFAAYPSPSIESVKLSKSDVSAGESFTVSVNVKNVGRQADLQTVQVSFPNLQNKNRITVLSHDIGNKNVTRISEGAELYSRYGYEKINSEHARVEFKPRIGNNKKETFKIRVSPQSEEDFPILIKSVARIDGTWTYSPQPDSERSIIVDDQREYAIKKSVSVSTDQNPQISLNSPVDGATPVSRDATLSWSPSDGATYDLYLEQGDQTPDEAVATGLTTASYTPQLDTGTTYYWKVVAKTNSGSEESDIWSFTTAEEQRGPTLDLANQTTVEGKTTTVEPRVSDFENPVSLSLEQAPDFVTLSNGQLSISPTADDSRDSPYSVTVVADDGTSTVTETINVVVQPPISIEAPSQVLVGESVPYEVVINNPDISLENSDYYWRIIQFQGAGSPVPDGKTGTITLSDPGLWIAQFVVVNPDGPNRETNLRVDVKPQISGFEATNPSENRVKVRFVSSHPVDDVRVEITRRSDSGSSENPSTITLGMDEFYERPAIGPGGSALPYFDRRDGVYDATVAVPEGGTYTVAMSKPVAKTDTVTVDIPKNEAPEASLSGPDQATVGSAIMLDASESTDPDGDDSSLTYSWSVTDQPTDASVTPPSGPIDEVTFPTAGSYEFELTVTDADGSTDNATVQITVEDATTPTATPTPTPTPTATPTPTPTPTATPEPTPLGVETKPADSGDAGATFNGNLTGLGGASSATVYFVYWQTDTPDEKTWWTGDSVTSPTEFSADVDLAAGTDYTVRTYAQSSDGTWVAGDTVEFSTTGAPYDVSFDEATDIGPRTANLTGELTGLGGADSAQVFFTYRPAGPDSSSTTWWTGTERTEPSTFTTEITGLSPGTTYTVQAYAQSTDGRWVSSGEATFQTSGNVLSADTHAPASIGVESAALKGEIESLGTADSATTYITYWETGSKESTLTWWTGPSLSSAQNYTADIGLAAGTDYTAQVLIQSDDGRWKAGDTVEFTTNGNRYTVETLSAANVSAGSAELRGNLTGIGAAESATAYVTYWEEGRKDETLSWWTGSEVSGPSEFTAEVSLAAGTTYKYRAYAKDSTGAWKAGSVQNLTTDGNRFAVETNDVTIPSSGNATLSGTLRGVGDAESATVYLVYWEKGKKSETTTWWTGASQTGPAEFTTTVEGLDSGTTYVARAYARDSTGAWKAGTPVEFQPGSPPASMTTVEFSDRLAAEYKLATSPAGALYPPEADLSA